MPPGSGTVQQGKEIFARLGAKCHGAKGEGGEGGPPLVGGIGSLEHRCAAEDGRQLLAVRHRCSTTTSIGRCRPTTRSRWRPDEVYALCAYLLYLNGIVPEDAVMDAQTLPQVVMPNHAGFTSPDPAARCLQCRRGFIS